MDYNDIRHYLDIVEDAEQQPASSSVQDYDSRKYLAACLAECALDDLAIIIGDRSKAELIQESAVVLFRQAEEQAETASELAYQLAKYIAVQPIKKFDHIDKTQAASLRGAVSVFHPLEENTKYDELITELYSLKDRLEWARCEENEETVQRSYSEGYIDGLLSAAQNIEQILVKHSESTLNGDK